VNQRKCREIISKRSLIPEMDWTARRCERCGAPEGQSLRNRVTLHHRRKRSQLPRERWWEPSNCVILCGDGTWGCHGWVEHNPDAARDEGFHVRSFEEAREVPIRLWHHSDFLVYLDDEGGFDLQPPGGDNG
jgi:hypothetical protein